MFLMVSVNNNTVCNAFWIASAWKYICNALNLARITRLKKQYNILPTASALIVFIQERKKDRQNFLLVS